MDSWYTHKKHEKYEGVKFACNQCEQHFTTKNSLKTHIKSIHIGIKYGCDHCDNVFTQKAHLITHMKKKGKIHKKVTLKTNHNFTDLSWIL